jgi:putative transposase
VRVTEVEPIVDVLPRPAAADADDLALMALIDRQYLARPYYGSRPMTAWLKAQGHAVNRKRVRRLMRMMGLEAIYQRPRTSAPAADHEVYPNLLRGLAIERVNQVWAVDINHHEPSKLGLMRSFTMRNGGDSDKLRARTGSGLRLPVACRAGVGQP